MAMHVHAVVVYWTWIKDTGKFSTNQKPTRKQGEFLCLDQLMEAWPRAAELWRPENKLTQSTFLWSSLSTKCEQIAELFR